MHESTPMHKIMDILYGHHNLPEIKGATDGRKYIYSSLEELQMSVKDK